MLKHFANLECTLSHENCRSIKEFIRHFISELTNSQDLMQRLDKTVDLIMAIYIENNQSLTHPSHLSFEIEKNQNELILTFINRGMPIYYDLNWTMTKADQFNSEKFLQLVQLVSSYEAKNLGRVGQCLKAKFIIEDPKPDGPVICQSEDLSDAEILIRKLLPGEEPELSRLFYRVYGYNYINESVYYPTRLKDMIEAGDLTSYVAVTTKGRIVGHVGLVRYHRDPDVYEAALGLTDPNVKSRGLFSEVFKHVMDEASKIDMAFCVYDFVTNLIFSQKLVAKYGTCDMALNIGCQVPETQAKLAHLGLGEDPEGMDRYSILIGVKPGSQYPLGKRVTLPLSMGEIAEFILEPLNIAWMPSPRFFPMMREGSYTRNLHPTQKAVYYRFYEPGQKALRAIINDWRSLLRSGYQYAAIDMPLDKPGIGQLHDILSSCGFFMAGFIPYEFTPRLGFRFQSIGPTKVAFDKIQVYSDTAKHLKNLIQEDYERNVLI